jgi:hypothetical protein
MKTKDVDGRVKPGHDDPYGGVRIFSSKIHRHEPPLGLAGRELAQQ